MRDKKGKSRKKIIRGFVVESWEKVGLLKM